MEPIGGLLDPDLAAELASTGFVSIGGLLDDRECAALESVFCEAMSQLDRPIGTRWFPTILLPEPDVRAFITARAGAIVLPKLESLFDPEVLEPVRIDYSVKPAGPDGELGPHQDFSIVDERVWTSLYFWIPLVDSDDHNGTLRVLPGSHRFTNRVRSRHVPATFDRVLDEVVERSISLRCSAGDVVVMVSGLVHHSRPNHSDALRLAVHGILKPIEAPLVFYFADDATPPDEVEMYHVDIDQYVELALAERPPPGLAPDDSCPRPPSDMTPERFASWWGRLDR